MGMGWSREWVLAHPDEVADQITKSDNGRIAAANKLVDVQQVIRKFLLHWDSNGAKAGFNYGAEFGFREHIEALRGKAW